MPPNGRKLAQIDKALSDAQNATARLSSDDINSPSLAKHGDDVWLHIENLRRAIRKAGRF